ncbi:MAG: RND family transporter [Pseudomonadales bacterium]|nr:RND family transporter [Pseudomonadales bacterium]
MLVLLAVTVAACLGLQRFSFDASVDTLVVEGDPGVARYLEMNDIFGGDEFIVLTWRPRHGELLAASSLADLAQLQTSLEALPGVQGVFSVLDAPLLQSPPVPVEKLSDGYKTLRMPGTDKSAALQELRNSPLYSSYLMARDGSAMALRVDLQRESELEEIRQRKDRLLAEQTDPADPQQLEKLQAELGVARRAYVDRRAALISNIRALRSGYEDRYEIFISGVPMIASDMIQFVRADLKIFGSLAFAVILVLLFFFFRRPRWVLLPVVISAVSIAISMGILGWMEKPVTVISSNFISLMAIICISFSIHLIVRYRELLARHPERTHRDLVEETMRSKFAPCLYTALTTLLAFGSMLVSHIVPVEDFGWMMCLGIVISFLVTYLLFPSILLLIGKGEAASTLAAEIGLTQVFSRWVRHHNGKLLLVAAMISVFALMGIRQVSFENRFIDYFGKDTDIYQGMRFIDENLGGTVPFDIYLHFTPHESVAGGDDFFGSSDPYPERYWYTPGRLAKTDALEQAVAAMNGTGKTISLATLERVARQFNDGEPLEATELSYVLGQIPADIRAQVIEPYGRPDQGLMRINVRMKESGAYFSMDQIVADIRSYATGHLGMEQDRVIVTGMMVLFNDMLKQLADSQIRTLFYVVGATFVMFALLLRSVSLAVLALIPNILAAASIIAVMGYLGIPLDMMTITIAAICIGIGVDDAIHYLHRFREELAGADSVAAAIEAAHNTIGRAMYFTSVVIMAGFSILAFSSFMPSVYFGLLTALAMLLALLANLTLLPALLLFVNQVLGLRFHR